MGFGAHLDLQSAVVRAATELAQLGLGGASGGLGGMNPRLRADDQPHVLPDPDRPPQTCAAPFSGGLVDALERCRAAVEEQGLELLVLDQTRPDIGLPVVKAMVPGLRHFWPRFGSGRLYDVPVTLGLIDRPWEEHELNPIAPVS
jgi:ribosomal protein S12 methylthiotransferase accessory factor